MFLTPDDDFFSDSSGTNNGVAANVMVDATPDTKHGTIPDAVTNVATTPTHQKGAILLGNGVGIDLLTRGDGSRIKLTLRLPLSIHERVINFASAHNLSINTTIALILDGAL